MEHCLLYWSYQGEYLSPCSNGQKGLFLPPWETEVWEQALWILIHFLSKDSHLMSGFGSRNSARVAQPPVGSLTLKAKWSQNAKVASISGKAEVCSCMQAARYFREPDRKTRQPGSLLWLPFYNKADILISLTPMFYFLICSKVKRGIRELPIGVLKPHKHHNRVINCNCPWVLR